MARPLAEPEAKGALSPEQQVRLARLVTEQFAFVWRLLRRIGVPASDADDAAQQVFISVSQRIQDIRRDAERAFVTSTALHVGARSRRSRGRKREDFGVELEQHVDPTPSQEELLDHRRAREVLDAMLDEMPIELRVVFVLYEIEQLTSQEIAEIVGVPLGTVASRLRRAREDFAARVARAEARRNFGGKPHG
ncbi:MAG: sigma-70 family RNA polymerase sigma factor [Polyangiaceae bacterium]